MKRNTSIDWKLHAKAHTTLNTEKIAMVRIAPLMRPMRSASQPKKMAPTSCPAKPAAMRRPIWPGASFHMPISTGRT